MNIEYHEKNSDAKLLKSELQKGVISKERRHELHLRCTLRETLIEQRRTHFKASKG